MKAGIAGFVSALIAHADSGSGATDAVGALFTTDEETGSRGAAAAAALLQDLPVELIVVAEPTDGVPFRGHKGVTWIRIRTEGVAAHGSTPELGVSAIRRMFDLTRRGEELEAPDWDTMNVGLISGGSAPNIVPAEAEATIDLRTSTVGTDVVAWWREQPEASSVDVTVNLRPIMLDPTDEVIARLGIEVTPRVASYFTDASVLADALSCERVLLWGPGDVNEAHRRDESVAVHAITAITAAYSSLIESWCSLEPYPAVRQTHAPS
jgi:succinyl-diaminopimelate desuccinylase